MYIAASCTYIYSHSVRHDYPHISHSPFPHSLLTFGSPSYPCTSNHLNSVTNITLMDSANSRFLDQHTATQFTVFTVYRAAPRLINSRFIQCKLTLSRI